MESSQKLLEWNDSINQEGNDVFSFEQRLNLFISFVISSTLFKTFVLGDTQENIPLTLPISLKTSVNHRFSTWREKSALFLEKYSMLCNSKAT